MPIHLKPDNGRPRPAFFTGGQLPGGFLPLRSALALHHLPTRLAAKTGYSSGSALVSNYPDIIRRKGCFVKVLWGLFTPTPRTRVPSTLDPHFRPDCVAKSLRPTTCLVCGTEFSLFHACQKGGGIFLLHWEMVGKSMIASSNTAGSRGFNPLAGVWGWNPQEKSTFHLEDALLTGITACLRPCRGRSACGWLRWPRRWLLRRCR